MIFRRHRHHRSSSTTTTVTAQEASGPVVNGRFAGFVTGLFQERDERGTARAAEGFLCSRSGSGTASIGGYAVSSTAMAVG